MLKNRTTVVYATLGSSLIYFNAQKNDSLSCSCGLAFAQHEWCELALGADGPLLMVSVLSACRPVTSEKNLMTSSIYQFGKKS